jgi:O-antigen ligase
MQLPSVPLSLAPERTIASLPWLVPVAATFLLTVHMSSRWRRRLAWVLLGAAVVSVALSAFQLIGGQASPLRPYQITNPNRAVGFFASANHLPTLILCALPFAGLLAGRAFKSRTAQAKGSGLTLAVAAALFLLVGIVVSGSAAGYGLLIPTALASFLVYKRAVSGQLSWVWAAAVGGLLLLFVAVGTAGPVGKEALAGKFSEHPTSRRTIWENSVSAAEDFFPVGSGLGTFSAVYRTYENPEQTGREFVNHAHNDYLELALELGAAGLLLVIAFLLWWVRATARAWRNEFHGVELARAGSVMVGILLLHSLVDYPLRTSALAAVFAMACAFLMQAPAPRVRSSSAGEASTGPGPRHLEAD